MAELKIYVLLDEYKSTIGHYRRVNKDTRIRIEDRPVDHAYLRLTFYDNKTKLNRTARLKLGCDTIWQDEQIKLGILANEPFTNAERKAVQFNYGVLMTRNELVQTYLETVPHFEGFDGECDAVKRPLYKLQNKFAEIKATNQDFKRRLQAANKIATMEDLKELQDLMIRLNGTFFKPPTTVEECQNGLVEFVNEADDAMIEKLMSETVSLDEEIMIIVGRAVDAGIISYNQKLNFVSMKKGNDWVDVKVVSSELPPPERERQFMEFLSTKDGATLFTDIKNKLGETEKPKTKKGKQVEQPVE